MNLKSETIMSRVTIPEEIDEEEDEDEAREFNDSLVIQEYQHNTL